MNRKRFFCTFQICKSTRFTLSKWKLWNTIDGYEHFTKLILIASNRTRFIGTLKNAHKHTKWNERKWTKSKKLKWIWCFAKDRKPDWKLLVLSTIKMSCDDLKSFIFHAHMHIDPETSTQFHVTIISPRIRVQRITCVERSEIQTSDVSARVYIEFYRNLNVWLRICRRRPIELHVCVCARAFKHKWQKCVKLGDHMCAEIELLFRASVCLSSTEFMYDVRHQKEVGNCRRNDHISLYFNVISVSFFADKLIVWSRFESVCLHFAVCRCDSLNISRSSDSSEMWTMTSSTPRNHLEDQWNANRFNIRWNNQSDDVLNKFSRSTEFRLMRKANKSR